MHILIFIAKHSVIEPEELQISPVIFPFSLAPAGTAPSFMGRNSDGSISVALFPEEGRYVVVTSRPVMRIEGYIAQIAPILAGIESGFDATKYRAVANAVLP